MRKTVLISLIGLTLSAATQFVALGQESPSAGAPAADTTTAPPPADPPPAESALPAQPGAGLNPTIAPASGEVPATVGLGPQTSVPIERPMELIPDATGFGPAVSVPSPKPTVPRKARNIIDQTWEEAKRKSNGCMECHKQTDAHTMHESPHVVLGCTDCHGGNAKPGLGILEAHILPRNPEYFRTSANPPNATVLLNQESREFIRFINPGDLRTADLACGTCHGDITGRVYHSMMNHGGMLWNAAGYNNGALPNKNPLIGMAYSPHGEPLILTNPFKPTPEQTRTMGILELIVPIPRFNRSMPGNVFRIFEKGGAFPLQLGTPYLDEPPGKPERRLSERGLGTLNRTDPVVLSAQKSRLHDPLLGFMGSNDRPGDYRSSGCTACHVVYANDRSPHNSGFYSKYGHQGLSFSKDPMISKNERGHPIEHKLTRAIPSAMCMNCHMHQGNLFVNPYLGYIWWDQETDAEFMYPHPKNPLADDPYWRGKKTREQMTQQHDPTDDELVRETVQKPEAAAARGLWGDLDFVEKSAELNPKLKHTQFADYHGHGWMFRAIFKQDKKGNRLDINDKVIAHNDFKKAVHLKDIHLEKGMQCVDCHFDVDVHGNGLLYGEPRNITTIECIDCHGTISTRPTLITSGAGGYWNTKTQKIDLVDLSKTTNAGGPRFFWEGDKLYQRLNLDPYRPREVPQTMDIVNPYHPRFNAKARHAKTIQRDGTTWGKIPASEKDCEQTLAHSNNKFDCQICHTSWATSCFGCHLPMKANQRVPQNKNEGFLDRNFTTYNPQVVRDDVFQLGIDGTVKKYRMAVLRSSSAVVVSSQTGNREWVYSQTQTVSAEGYAGQAYNPHFAHTTSGKGTTKNCTECHIAKTEDNNAWMASLLGFGTGSVNFFGRFAWVGGDHALHGVIWTEPDEPQSVIGSSMHKYAYARNYEEHQKKDRILQKAYEHHASEIHDITLRQEYVYTANGKSGFEVFDVANIDNKGFSERFLTSPFSPLGQRTYVRTPYATSVALPSTLLNDPNRVRLPENEEQPIHPIYGHVFVTDRELGLVVVDVSTLFNGNPEDNFLYKDAQYNPEGKLTGANYAVCAGTRVYICTPRGLSVVNVNQPRQPRLVGEYTGSFLKNPRAIYIQFRYAFVTDEEGLKVLDITNPDEPVPVEGAMVHLKDAQKLYVARTYAYVANGHEGLAIIDVQRPEHPKLFKMFNADGQLNDTRAVQIGSVAASMYALVADGHNGLRVIQMISPDTVEGSSGFSPVPNPRLIATYPTKHAMLAVSRGLDRDRVVDETGNQTVVFGRRGSRPFKVEEMYPFYRSSKGGQLYRVEDTFVRDGKLVTSAGRELIDPNPPPKPSIIPSQKLDLRPGVFPSLDLNVQPLPKQIEPASPNTGELEKEAGKKPMTPEPTQDSPSTPEPTQDSPSSKPDALN